MVRLAVPTTQWLCLLEFGSNSKSEHPVLITDHYDEEIERLTGLGATPLNEINLPAVRWTTFADPGS
jgi:hypothetical protein